MAIKEISSFLSIFPGESDKDAKPFRIEVQAGNTFFRNVTRRRSLSMWDNNNSGSVPAIFALPWKSGGLLVDDDDNKGHFFFNSGTNTDYPHNLSAGLSALNFSKFRATGSAPTILAAAMPRVIGAVAAHDALSNGPQDLQFVGNSLLSITDVPPEYTQIGTVYQHPMIVGSADLTTTIGQSYVSFGGSHYLNGVWVEAHNTNLIRISSGADQGEYFVRFVDRSNNRLYLMNLNGTLFSPIASASGISWYCGPGRRAFFNEVSIIQLSTGVIATGGSFRPGRMANGAEVRNSFIMRVVLDKTGSDETATAAEKQGSYFITMKPYTHGEGLTNPPSSGVDWGTMQDSAFKVTGTQLPTGFNFFDGGVNGFSLVEVDQRLWFVYQANGGQAGIAHWRWKTAEALREVAWSGGAAGHASMLTPSLVLGSGDLLFGMHSGPEGVTYIPIYNSIGGNGGVALIKRDLTTLQYNNTTSGWFAAGANGSQVGALRVDSSRARIGTAGDVVTSAGTANFSSASAAFTDADIGRVIKVTGATNDNSTYKIATRVSGTAITVQTLAGGAVSFTGGTGGTFQIGERIYVFFNNNTVIATAPQGVGRINYMESLAFGSFFTRVVAMTNGSNVMVPIISHGEQPKLDIDQATGNVYWLSSDVQDQVNKYNPTTNTHSFLTIADVQAPAGGTGSIGTITAFTALIVNPKFDEIWVGSNQGPVKVVKSTFAAATAKRYFGETGNPTYQNPAGFQRPSAWSNSLSSTYNPRVLNFCILPDGKVKCQQGDAASNRSCSGFYSREADVFNPKEDWYVGIVYCYSAIFDSIGNWFQACPGSVSYNRVSFGSVEVQYQWDNANTKWIPLEVYQGALPQKSAADTISPGCQTRPIHSTLQDVLYGVKLKFTKQGGATPSNNEFLGRAGISKILTTDGVTTAAGTTFGGSGFVSGDVGNLLRIESGPDVGVYKITVFTNSTLVTVSKLDNTVASFAANSGLSYTVWTIGAAGATAGPECATVLLSDGFSKDNTQDISGITYENYQFKTILQEQAEAVKFCVPNPIGVPGGTEMKVYYEFFPRVGSQTLTAHDLQCTHARALPVAEWTSGGFNGRKLVDGFMDAVADGLGNRGTLWSSPSNVNIWYGVNPVSAALGCTPSVDIGADAEVGYVILRAKNISNVMAQQFTQTYHGLKATLYKANNAGGTPVAASVSRASGVTNLDLVQDNTTISVSSGDFLGPIFLASTNNGTVTAGGNTFTAPAATFATASVGMILKITAVGDVGSYRIIAIDGTNSILTIQNLDQTAKAWLGSASSIVYEIRDGVREEDVICTPNIGAPTQRLCIERLLTSTTAQVRVAPHTTISAQSWQSAIPTWAKVKRVSYSSEALPPDVKNNGTWVSTDGRERFTDADFKVYLDLTDLPTAARTGRWWQLQMMPRFANNQVSGDFYFSTMEFYSPAGARLGISKYTWSDSSLNNADFMSQHINRADFIQGAYSGINSAGFNGTVDLGGAGGDTLTLNTGGNKFLGFQVRRTLTDGVSTVGAGGNFSSATAAFITSDVGRILRIQTGADAGYYRINTVSSATAIIVTTPNGASVTFVGDTGRTFSIHEGFSVGGVAPDRIVFMDDLTREYTLASINDALTTITILESGQLVKTAKQWEVRRPVFDSSASSVDSVKLARMLHADISYPLQPGDVIHDSRGALRFWVDDIGTGNQRANGSIVGGSGVFVGTGFCNDDVGRILTITTGVNKGNYRISVFTSATSITVINEYTGAAVSFTVDAGPITYQIYGDRRFRLTRYVATLKA